MTPTAYGYVSLGPHHHRDDVEHVVRSAAERLARFAAGEGYTFAGVFTDVRGHTESGLYQLLAALRGGDAVAVVVPDLDHLRHVGCLTGADLHRANRYLRARVLPLAPDLDGTQSRPIQDHPASRPVHHGHTVGQRSDLAVRS